MNNHGFNAQLAEKDAYISELEMELERSTTVADQVQKQLTETLKRLRVSDQYSSHNRMQALYFITFLACLRQSTVYCVRVQCLHTRSFLRAVFCTFS